MTGTEVWNLTRQKAGFEYNRYYDTAKANRLLETSLTDVIWQKVLSYRAGEKEAEELQPLIVWGRTVLVNNNKIGVRDLVISSLSYSGVTVILTFDNHNFNSGDVITISGIQGVSGVDSVATITATSTTSITFNNSIFPTGSYTSNSGTVSSSKIISDYWYLLNLKCSFPSQSYYNYITGYEPINAMGRFFDQPTARRPRMELANNYINILPSDVQCTEAKVYYVKKPPISIDVSDNTRNLSLWLNDKLLNHITDVAVRNWKAYIGDSEGMNREQLIIQDNP